MKHVLIFNYPLTDGLLPKLLNKEGEKKKLQAHILKTVSCIDQMLLTRWQPYGPLLS